MKTPRIFSTLIPILLLTLSCESSDDPADNPADVTASELQATARDGQWRITYFFDSDKDETSDFAGYVFTFGADGVVTATNGTLEVTGTWSVTHDEDPFDDSPDDADDVDFNLFFSAPADFTELTDDWDILEYSASRIKLVDVSGGNGGTDYLTFEKL